MIHIDEAAGICVDLRPDKLTITFSELLPDMRKNQIYSLKVLDRCKARYKYHLLAVVKNENPGRQYLFTKPFVVKFTHITEEEPDRFLDSTIQKWIMDGLMGSRIFPSDSCKLMSLIITTRKPDYGEQPHTEVEVFPNPNLKPERVLAIINFDEIFPKSNLIFTRDTQKEVQIQQLWNEWKAKTEEKLAGICQRWNGRRLLIQFHHNHRYLFDVDNRFHGFFLEALRQAQLIGDTEGIMFYITGEQKRGARPRTKVEIGTI